MNRKSLAQPMKKGFDSMEKTESIKYYPPVEEKINIISHAIGFIFSIVATMLLVTRAIQLGNNRHIVSFGIFGTSLMILYAASTFYHLAQSAVTRKRLKVFDHASIYVLIAGTYTPFTLVTLKGAAGWAIFGISWGLALTGIVLKLYFTGKYETISTVMYILMGWIIVFAIKPLFHKLPFAGLLWLFAGGISYTIGAILYGIDKIKFNHAIFHVFVLVGSFCHFMSVCFYVLP
jgi:hemolysin III